MPTGERRRHVEKEPKKMSGNEYRKRLKLSIAAFLIATAGTLCLPQALNLKENALGFTNSIFSVFIWLLLLYAVSRTLRSIDLHDKRGWLIAEGTA